MGSKATKSNPYMPLQFFDAIGGQVTLGATSITGWQGGITVGIYLDNYGFRLFASPATGLGLHGSNADYGYGFFGANYNYDDVPDPDAFFAGNSVSYSLNAGEIGFSVSQSSDEQNPHREVPGYTTYTIGFGPGYGAESNISRTYLWGKDFYKRPFNKK